MKIFIVTLMIYCLMGIVLADEDVCTLIFDDCQTCVATQGCGWCDAGFCLSNTDNLFTCKNELTNDEKVCPESSSIRNKRQNPFCSISTSCLECNLIQGCGWCIFYPNSTNVATQTCQPITNPDLTNCPISPYTSENASFVTNCSNSGSNTNPVHSYTENGFTPGDGTGKRNEATKIPDPPNAINLTADEVCIYFTRGLNQRFEDIGSSIRVNPQNCDIQIWRAVDPEVNETIPFSDARSEFQLRWIDLPDNDVFDVENNTLYIIENYNPYLLPIVIAHIGRGGGSTPLSPGQVAGITIGSVFAFFLLLLLLLLLVLLLVRRMPQSGPFRAPQAAFRP